jgi:D-tagatose-1,6-bisphosphate aldolase subunit GatZ/KbaZ
MLTREFAKILQQNKLYEERVGVFSICSAHPDVLEASMLHAKLRGYLLIIEATSNQVNQFGGYTGMTPKDFVSFVGEIANRADYPVRNILLGGDHLGPNIWKNEPAQEAMVKACEMVRQFVIAGFRKIHLDASMFCADDLGDRSRPLDDEIVAHRSAMLCESAEKSWLESFASGDEPPYYIIGTEVPIPGGMVSRHSGVEPTSPEDALKTIEVTQRVFYEQQLHSAWDRVVGLVIQPGVEFGDDEVVIYEPDKARGLHRAIKPLKNLVCEAHSTDYQTKTALNSLVADHCCILKVGPWVTYAYREAMFSLELIEKELHRSFGFVDLSNLRETIEKIMMEEPKYWKDYYSDGPELSMKIAYSYSDRLRYYWPNASIRLAVKILLGNLEKIVIPRSLISQYFPIEYGEIMEGKLENTAKALLIRHIQLVLDIYADACGW